MKPIWLLAFLLFIVGCNNSKNFESDFSLFKDYIAQFTSGYISTHDPIAVELAFAKSDWVPNKELDRELFDISPDVKGKVVALSSSKVVFLPNEPLKQNQTYKVTFRLDECIKVPKELRKFNFIVKTIKQDFVVETQDLQSYSSDWQYLNAVVRSSDQLSVTDVKKMVTATQGNKNLHIKFDEKKSNATTFYFKIDSIQRAVEDSKITIKWDGDEADIDQKGELEYTIYGKNNFVVINAEVVRDEKTALYINFTDPLKKEQVFDGLVTIETANNLTFSVDGNLLKVFFDETLKGDLLVEVFQGIESVDGYKLKKNFTQKITFEQLKPNVEIVKSGTILPSANNLSVNFKVVNLSAVDVKVYRIYENNVLQFLQENDLDGSNSLRRVASPVAKQKISLQSATLRNTNKWNVYALDLSKLIQPEPGAIYRVEFSYKRAYSLYKCDAASTADNNAENNDTDENDNEEDSGYEYDDYEYYDDYDWQQRDNPCDNTYYYNKKVATNVLATDLGVIAKRGNNSYTIIVNNIVTTEPVSGANVEVFTYQKQSLGKYTTDGEGITTFELNKKAFFAVVKKDKNTTYVKLDDGYSQAVSSFDVDGEVVQKGLKGYIYGERGVWRPGDTVFLSFILNDLAAKLPISHPIKLRLADPLGKTVYQSVQSRNELNHYTFAIPTAANAPTGNWEAVVSVGGAKFYKAVKIETIKPNRLKIKNNLADKIISAQNKNTGNITVTWMHGAAAKDLKIDMQGKMMKNTTSFSKYPGYTFDNPTVNFTTEEINLYSGKVNDVGQANFTLQPNIESQAPGMLKMAMITKVYENGGDFSTDVATATYSPFTTYVGLKTPAPNKYGMLETGAKQRFDVVTVNENGLPKRTENLQVKVYKVDYRWWWRSSGDDLSDYNAATSRTTYYTTTINTDATGKASFSFAADEADWGRYLILVSDENSGHTTGQTVFIDYPYWSGKTKNGNGDNASMLVFNSDKQKYNVGEKAKISFPSSEGCRALLSVENGSKVLTTQWVKTTAKETQVEIDITENMAPNIYVYITLLQPHSFTKNDLPIRLYGILPIEVVNKNTQLEPIVSMPEVLRPEQTTTINISEKNGKAMSYTIDIVDEGLLDLTRFKTPNAWNSFYAKEALGVKTWDVYDDIIGAFSGKISQIFSIGGDQEIGGGKAKKANRFKPVVIHLGPFKLSKGQTASHTIKIPNYIGSVKTMVVAANAEDGAYGATEKVTPVRSPLMILASFPRKISPSEKITVPVTVFAMENHVKNVSLQLKTNNFLVPISAASQSLSFASPDEKMAYFEVEAGNLTGIGKLSIVATSGKEKAVYDIEVDVINPNPVTHLVKEAVIDGNGTASIDWAVFGVSGSNKAQLEISTLPPINLGERLDYLIQYPHGCVEQTTSGVFPQLYLADLLDLSDIRKQAIQRNITAGIEKLTHFQTASGGFAYWQGMREADDWASSYVGHFLLEAEKKGYTVPAIMKNNWMNYQKRVAKEWRMGDYGNDFAQAYRLYSLAFANSPDVASMNRLRETKGISNDAKLRLAMAYALIGQKNIAFNLLNTSTVDPVEKYYYYYGSAERNRAMILETYLLLDRKAEAFQMAEKVAASLSSNAWMSTQSTAFSLMAVSKFAKTVAAKECNVTISYDGKAESVRSSKFLIVKELKGTAAVTIKNNIGGTVYARVIVSGILPVGQELEESRGLALATKYVDAKGNPLNISSLPQGTSFTAYVTVTNTKPERITNVALTQILPSGWEIVNTRYTEVDNTADNKVDYMDIRDDRANYYFSLGANESKIFKLSLNASYPGSYYLPGAQCEAMYDNNFLARKKGQWIKVIKE